MKWNKVVSEVKEVLDWMIRIYDSYEIIKIVVEFFLSL
jgi:hypothetical protein